MAAMHSNLCKFLLFAAAYFLVNTLFYRVAGDPGWVPALSLVTFATIVGFWVWNRRRRAPWLLELTGYVISFLLIANALLDIALEYRTIKTMNLLLLLPAFAVSGVRPRVVLITICVAILGFLASVYRYEPAAFVDSIWVAFAGLVVGMGLAMVIRATILKAVRARLAADENRDQAVSLATFDALTGLANRRAFMKQLDERLKEPESFYLGIIDLDGFKPINDIYGHAAGDRVLVDVARRLSEVCGEASVVARLGGDEFAVMLFGLTDETTWRTRADALCATLAAPYGLDNETAHLSASLGFTHRLGQDDEETPSRLLERADYALYEAKERGRGIAVLFDHQHEALIRSTKAVEQALRSINGFQELTLVFQPQFNTETRRTVAFEALARWHSEKLGQVPPDVFIRAAERSGLITSLTPTLLEKALLAAKAWPEDIRLAFNLSARDLLSPVSVERIIEVVRASGMSAQRIEFEITETAMLTDFGQAQKAISRFGEMGCRIALDDFGSGYTNFNYINRVKVDAVKIDRSFVLELGKNDRAQKIIKSIIELATNLGMDHVVEGVETVDELAQIRAVGGVQVQGYLFGKPMPGHDIPAFLAQELGASVAKHACTAK